MKNHSQLGHAPFNDKRRRLHSILHIRCQHKRSCRIVSTNEEFGDPCPGTYKYLTVKAGCVPQWRTINYWSRKNSPPELSHNCCGTMWPDWKNGRNTVYNLLSTAWSEKGEQKTEDICTHKARKGNQWKKEHLLYECNTEYNFSILIRIIEFQLIIN